MASVNDAVSSPQLRLSRWRKEFAVLIRILTVIALVLFGFSILLVGLSLLSFGTADARETQPGAVAQKECSSANTQNVEITDLIQAFLLSSRASYNVHSWTFEQDTLPPNIHINIPLIPNSYGYSRTGLINGRQIFQLLGPRAGPFWLYIPTETSIDQLKTSLECGGFRIDAVGNSGDVPAWRITHPDYASSWIAKPAGGYAVCMFARSVSIDECAFSKFNPLFNTPPSLK